METRRFEPFGTGVRPRGGLANRCFRPLSHVSARSFGPKVRLTSNTLRADWLLHTQEVKTIRVGGSCFVSSRSLPQAEGDREKSRQCLEKLIWL